MERARRDSPEGSSLAWKTMQASAFVGRHDVVAEKEDDWAEAIDERVRRDDASGVDKRWRREDIGQLC